MPEIAFLMGKSSSGKDNIFKALVGDKELNLKTVIMYTTRPMRAGEKEGVEYYYVDNEKALVHKRELADYPHIEYIEMPDVIKGWGRRLWCEYVGE